MSSGTSKNSIHGRKSCTRCISPYDISHTFLEPFTTCGPLVIWLFMNVPSQVMPPMYCVQQWSESRKDFIHGHACPHSGNRAVNITEKIIERTKAFFGCKLWGLSSAANVPGKFSCQCPYQRLPDRLLVSGKNWLFTWLNTCTAFFIFNSRPKYFCSVLFHFIALAWHRPFTMI